MSSKQVCVKYVRGALEGQVRRTHRDEAAPLVSAGKASYISRSHYKKAIGEALTPAREEDLRFGK